MNELLPSRFNAAVCNGCTTGVTEKSPVSHFAWLGAAGAMHMFAAAVIIAKGII